MRRPAGAAPGGARPAGRAGDGASSTSIPTPTSASCTPGRWPPTPGCRSTTSCASPSSGARRARRVAVGPARRRRGAENAEFVAIALLLQGWDDIAPWLVEELFADDVARRAFLALADADGDLEPRSELADPEAREVLERAAVADIDADPAPRPAT